MSGWPALVDAAVVGTGRASVPSSAPALAGLSAGSPGSTAGNDAAIGDAAAAESDRLLHAAAAVSRARRAGYQPAQASDVAAPEPAPADGRAEVSAAAARRLGELLAADRTELILEWLRLLAQTGCRPPDVLVPDLLTAASGSRELRAAITRLLGPLAAWLAAAAANREWAWVTTLGPGGQLDPAGWPTASHRDRRELLEALRRTDPAAGRELMLTTWAGDTARDRAAFIAALAAGLGPADEELLERGLADRRGEVRLAAAGLLARLPGSRFSARAADRAAGAVTVQRSLVGRRLVVTAPGDATKDMVADCIDPSPPRGTGRRAWLLRHVVAAAPAAWWPGHTGLAPAGLLALATGSEWADPLQSGWTDAAVRDGDAAWISALLARPGGGTDRHVFQAFSAADREEWLCRHPDGPLFGALDLVPAPWSAGLSAVVRTRLAGLSRADPRQFPEARRLLRLAGTRLDPPAAPQVDPAQVHPRLLDSWTEMLTTLFIRAAMRRELLEEPRP